ncbi:MAG TPA: DUF3443 domain-containing protein [Steroidobacteraceae bacterium]
MRKFVALALIQLMFVAACGGGGGYGGGGGSPPPPPPPMQTIATPGPPNVETLTVDAGPANGVNQPFVSVKVCAPATTNCKTIDHVWLDSGSSGLRILASVLSAAPALTLPPETNGVIPLAECQKFVDGSTWGTLAVADMQLPVSGETASNLNVQVIGDPTYPVPADCTPPIETTVMTFGANGILGVGPFIQDCGSACVSTVIAGTYYSCPTPGSACTGTMASLAQQVQNPVSVFVTDNNGVIVELPSVGSAGMTTVSGSVVFGIGTRTNNALGTATVLPADKTNAFITATYKGTVYINGYVDSGSTGNFFTDSSFSACASPNAGFYCPASTMNETATLKGTSSSTLTANFSVANATTLFATTSYSAFSNLGGPISDPKALDLGLPFYYGHNVFTAIENANTPGGIGPYFAY